MPSQESYDKTFIEMAFVISKLSKDPRTKVGAIIVSADNRKLSIGYNGFVKGIEETTEKWQAPLKYEFVIHAETNALINCPFDKQGCTIYCTHQPCHRCIEQVAQSGIIRVVYAQPYANLQYKELWNEHAKLFKEVVHLNT